MMTLISFMQEQMFLEGAESLDMGEGEEINHMGFIGLVHSHTLVF